VAYCIEVDTDFELILKETYEIILKSTTISKKTLFNKSSLDTNELNKCIRYLKRMNLITPKSNLFDMRTILYTVVNENVSIKDIEAIMYDLQ